MDSCKKRVASLDLFNNVDFSIIDRNKLITRYDEIKLKVEKEVIFDRHAVLPDIDGIRQAYIGVMSCQELLKLITNSDGGLPAAGSRNSTTIGHTVAWRRHGQRYPALVG